MNAKTCDICQAPIPPHAPGGLCPACVLRGAEEPPPLGRAAPPPEEIADAFPKLEILGAIGQGGMGFVYKARQPDLDRVVALKILAPELGRDPAFAERFAREARTLAKLHHPNIVTVFEHGESGGFFYLLMEYVDGVSLRQAMRTGRFSPEQALAIVPGICDALQAAHAQGIWHRDIKPENILLDRDGGVKIADFGIARIVGDPQRDFTLTMTGNALGSAAYMAPEQHEKPHDVDHRADIYSLGVVIYEMLTGELPLGRFPLPSQRAEVNARIDEIVLRTLEKERELRQQSAEEVKTEVAGVGQASGREFATQDVQPAPFSMWSLGLMTGGLLIFLTAAVFTSGQTQGLLLALAVASLTMGWLMTWFALSSIRSGRISCGWRLVLRMAAWSPLALALIAAAVTMLYMTLNRSSSRGALEDRQRQVEAMQRQAADLQKMASMPTKGGDHLAFTVHINEKPIIMVISDSLVRLGVGNSPNSQFNWSALRIENVDRATLAGEAFDLTKGRVFLHLSDGTFHQIEAWPERILSGEELENFAESLKPAETMLKVLEAAKSGDQRLFRQGLSKSFIDAMQTDPFRDDLGFFAGLKFIKAEVVGEGTAEVLLETSGVPKRRITYRMIREDESWKLTEHVL